MIDISTEVILISIVWVVIVVAVTRITTSTAEGSVGLPTAFLFATTFSYCGFISYASPGYSHLRPDGSLYLKGYGFTEETVLAGVYASLLAVFGFLVGCLIRSRRGRRDLGARFKIGREELRPPLLALGTFGFGALIVSRFTQLLGIEFPLLSAILKVGQNSAIVTICVGAAYARLDKGNTYWKWVLLGAGLPVFYVVAFAMTWNGFIAFSVFAAFWIAVLAPARRSAFKVGLASAGIFYCMLCLYVGWMSFRVTLRTNDDLPLVERTGIIVDGLMATEFLTPTNFAALDELNTRLNQYIFVGKMIEWHEQNPHLRLYGTTLALAPLAILPRFIWPDKPEMGGSAFVATHTGMSFSRGVTFGSGPVMEFYANFGYPGILLGFALLGVIVRQVDLLASVALRRGAYLDAALWFVIGIAFVAPLTEFFFLFNTALFSWGIMFALSRVLTRRQVERTSHVAAQGLRPRTDSR